MATQIELVISAKDQASGVLGRFGKALGGISKVALGVGAGIGALGVTAAAVGGVMVKSAAQYEQQQIAFKTLLGTSEAANEALNRIKEDAKLTPFELPGLIKANQLLLSAGVSAEQASSDIKALGNAISATGGGQAELDRLALNLQQIRAVGNATSLDIKQFAFAGIPIFDLLAESMGKSVEEIKALGAEAITYDEITKALQVASEKGGRFFGAMENQSTSLNGIISNLKDTFGILGTEIAMESGLFDAVKDSAGGFLELLSKHTDTIKAVTKGVVGLVIGLKELITQDEGERFQEAMDALKIPPGVQETIKDVANAFGNFFRTTKKDLPNIIARLKEFVSAFLQSEGFKTFLNVVRVIFQAVGKFLAGAGTQFKILWSEIVNMFNSQLKPAFNDLVELIGPMFKSGSEESGNFLDMIFQVGKAVVNIAGIFVKQGIFIITILIKIVTFFVGLGIAFNTLTRETIPNAWNSVKEFFASIPGWLQETVINPIISAWDAVILFFQSIPTRISEFVVSSIEFLRQLPIMIATFVGEMIGHIVAFAITAPQKIEEFKMKAAAAILNFALQAIGSFLNLKDQAIQFVGNLVVSIGQFFYELPGKVAIFLNNLVQVIKSKFTQAKDSGIEQGNKIKEFFTNTLPNSISNGVEKIKGFFLGIPGALKSGFNTIIGNFETAVNSILEGYNTIANNTPGMSALSTISIPRLSQGGDFITKKPTMFVAGEGGQQERVQVTPLSQERGGGNGGGIQNVNLNLNIPLFMGDSTSKRIVAEEIWKELSKIAKGDGVNLPNLNI